MGARSRSGFPASPRRQSLCARRSVAQPSRRVPIHGRRSTRTTPARERARGRRSCACAWTRADSGRVGRCVSLIRRAVAGTKRDATLPDRTARSSIRRSRTGFRKSGRPRPIAIGAWCSTCSSTSPSPERAGEAGSAVAQHRSTVGGLEPRALARDEPGQLSYAKRSERLRRRAQDDRVGRAASRRRQRRRGALVFASGETVSAARA